MFMGFAGLLSTFVFASLTTMAFILFAGLSMKKLLGSLIYGLGFYITHMISNTIIFITIVPVLLSVLSKRIAPYYTTKAREA